MRRSPWLTRLGALLLVTGLAGCTTIQKVHVRSYPAGARILIDGQDSGQTTPDNVVLPLDEKSHEISIVKPGYNPVVRTVKLETDVDVIGGREVATSICCAPCCLGLPLLNLLKPVSVTKAYLPGRIDAELDVEGQGVKLGERLPPHLEVLIDGRLQQPLDDRYLTMSPGTHELRARAEGYRDMEVMLHVDENRYQELDLRLAVAGQGILLTVSPPGSRVLLNGQFQGMVEVDPLRLRCAPGPVELRVEREGYLPWTDIVRVTPERYEELDLVLSLEGQGVILHRPGRLRRSQNRVQVLIDDEIRATEFDAPLRLEPGSHRVEVRIPGFRTWKVTVNIQEGQFLELEPDLKR